VSFGHSRADEMPRHPRRRRILFPGVFPIRRSESVPVPCPREHETGSGSALWRRTRSSPQGGSPCRVWVGRRRRSARSTAFLRKGGSQRRTLPTEPETRKFREQVCDPSGRSNPLFAESRTLGALIGRLDTPRLERVQPRADPRARLLLWPGESGRAGDQNRPRPCRPTDQSTGAVAGLPPRLSTGLGCWAGGRFYIGWRAHRVLTTVAATHEGDAE
jgi:hypothetical protein